MHRRRMPHRRRLPLADGCRLAPGRGRHVAVQLQRDLGGIQEGLYAHYPAGVGGREEGEVCHVIFWVANWLRLAERLHSASLQAEANM